MPEQIKIRTRPALDFVSGDGSSPDVKVEEILSSLPEEARRDRVVISLLQQGLIQADQVKQAIQLWKENGKGEALWRYLLELPDVDVDAVYRESARIYAFREVDVEEFDAAFIKNVLEAFTEEQQKQLLQAKVVPLTYELEARSGLIKLVFISYDPTRPETQRLLRQLRLEQFELCYAPKPFVEKVLEKVFPRRNEFLERVMEESAFDLGLEYETEENDLFNEDALEAEINRSALINLFEAALVEAVHMGASDIHVFPDHQKRTEFMFRIDGRLQRWHREEKFHPEAILAVIKDNTLNVDRFERDIAQDGAIQRWIDGTLIRFRVSVLPIATSVTELKAESIVIRVIDDRKVITDLSKLGLSEQALKRFHEAISKPHGMVILTGPTGSGKSTTLVAALHQVMSPEINVLTVEDPVEYIIKGARQIKLNHKLGLEQALRAILRHDPDVVMVGEMRDKPTAELAIKLANTGHLTFSTLHTNDAVSAVSRLYKMGIEPFLIAYAINLVVAQRLIRKLCPECKTVDTDVDPVLLKHLGFSEEDIETTTFYKKGEDESCFHCGGRGYKGRQAIAEALYFSPAIRKLIVESGTSIDEDGLRQLAIEEGMLTLAASAREVVKAGNTTIEEMLRVVAGE